MSKTGLVPKLGLAIVSTIFALFLCEMLLRVFWPAVEPTDLRGMVVPDAQFGHRFIPHSSKVICRGGGEFTTELEINSHGFRSPEYEMKPEPGTFRIALFGDSEVFGIGVDEENMLNVRMEELLNQGGNTHYEVLNFAIPATGTIVQERILEQIALDWEPDAAIFVVTVTNDLIDNAKLTNRQRVTDLPRRRPNAIRRGVARLRLYAFAGFKVYPNLPGFLMPPARWFDVVPPSIASWYMNSDLEGSFALMTDALSRCRDRCTEHEVDMYLAAIPARWQFVPAIVRRLRKMTERSVLQTVEADWDRPQRMLKSFASDQGMLYVEVLDEFKELVEQGAQLKYPNDGHLNAEGTFELARILAEGIRDKQRADRAEDREAVPN